MSLPIDQECGGSLLDRKLPNNIHQLIPVVNSRYIRHRVERLHPPTSSAPQPRPRLVDNRSHQVRARLIQTRQPARFFQYSCYHRRNHILCLPRSDKSGGQTSQLKPKLLINLGIIHMSVTPRLRRLQRCTQTVGELDSRNPEETPSARPTCGNEIPLTGGS